MDKITRYDWHGNYYILLLLFVPGITMPWAVVYFITHLLCIETQVPDGEELSEYLQARK